MSISHSHIRYVAGSPSARPINTQSSSSEPRGRAERIATFAALAAIVIAAVTLIGWITTTPLLTSLVPGIVPMNPVTAVSCLIAAAGALMLRGQHDQRRALVRLFGGVAIVLPLLCLSRVYLPWDLGPDRLLFMKSLALPIAGFINRMAPVTAGGFALSGLSLTLLTMRSPQARRAGLAAAIVVGLVGLAVIIDYGYQARTPGAVSGFIPVAFNTALALLCVSIALLAARPNEGVTLLFRDTGIGSSVARRLLPAAVIIPTTVGWLELRGADFGWYGAATGSALVAIITTVLLIALVWRNALSVNRADEARGRAERELRDLNQTLEAQVELRTRALELSNAELHSGIAAKRHAEAELRRAADDLRGSFEASPLAICSLSPDDIVLSWNRAAETLFGWSATEVIGQPLPIVHDALQQESEELTARVLAGKSVTDYETKRRCRDGSLREVSVSTAALYSESGAARGVVAVYTEIGQRKQLERQLHQAQKMDAIGQLAGGVAHDFNNILTVIQASAEFLSESLDESDVRREDALQIHVAAQRAARLTRQLLTFSRQGTAERQDIQLTGVVDQVESMLRRLLPANVELMIQHGAERGLVHADPNQLEQVIVNLVVNARDAMPHGGRIMIETQPAELDDHYASNQVGVTPGAYVMLTVTDTGAGMSLETQARIFEPFFTTKAAGEGTGLGLATVYGIVKQFNGHIWVYSEVGKGTTFKVYLPEVRSAASASIVAEPVAPPATTVGARVLLVEDHALVRRAVHAQLERQGYVVTDAENADQALALFAGQADSFDLVLSDMMMPGLSGLELRQQLRSDGVTTPVLLMSGYSEYAIKSQGSAVELAPHIEKPFTTALLVSEIEALLQSRSQARA
ncbi:MAG TPA: ATP-binding protein [Gemmatimonadales bacterium]|jgi:PAS domain S-box-containing protein